MRFLDVQDSMIMSEPVIDRVAIQNMECDLWENEILSK